MKDVTPLDIIIGNNIRKYRQLRKMSMQELAETTQISYQQLQKYELGKNRIPASRLVIVTEALFVPLCQIVRESI